MGVGGKRKESGTRWPEHWLDCIATRLHSCLWSMNCTKRSSQHGYWANRVRQCFFLWSLRQGLFSYDAASASISWKSLTSCNVLCSVVVGLSSLPPLRVGWWHSVPSQLYAALHVIDSSPSPILFFPILSLSCLELVRGVTNCAVPLVWAHVTKSLSINHWPLMSTSLVKRNLF